MVFSMAEVAISAVTGDLVSRFISFLMNKCNYSSRERLEEEKAKERLQHLLTRARTVVEEADGRYITNSGMLVQLKILSEAMYRGYCVLNTFRFSCQNIQESDMDKVSDRSSLSLSIPLKRSRTLASTRKDKTPNIELHGALENLEIVVSNMIEFVVLLGGCERMSRRPYDAYLYNENFMFGRHTEKKRVLSFLLQQSPPGPPAVLPIIGGIAVGKKTLVAHVCNDERVSLHFSSILRLNETEFLSIADHQSHTSGKVLVVVEFISDVDDVGWAKFYSSVGSMDSGSKVIILSRHTKSEKLGTVKPIFLSSLSFEEFSYLFKTLVFGSANPVEHPQLVRIGDEFVKELQFGWSLVPANAFSDVLRKNLNVHVWLSILNRYKRVIQKNLSIYGVHPNILFEQGHPVEIADIAPHQASPSLRVEPCTGSSNTTNLPKMKELQKVSLVELLVDPTVIPSEDFNLVSWESRLPPYTSIVHFVRSCPQEVPLFGRKRQRVRV